MTRPVSKRMPCKTSAETTDYDFNMTELLEDDETATALDVTLQGPDDEMELEDTDILLSPPYAKCWVSGGTHKKTYRLRCAMTTDTAQPGGGFRTPVAYMLIPVRDY